MVSLLFSFVSYHVVEKPLRNSNRFTNSDLKKICALLATVITVTNLVTMNFYDKLHSLTATQKQFLTYYSREGNSTYLKTIVEQSAKSKCDEESSSSRRKNPLEALPVNCILNKGMNQGTIILWGDSHAMHLRWGLLDSTSNSQFIVLTKDGCGARIQLSEDLNDGCSQYRYFATQIVSLAPNSQVIISQVTPWEYDDLKTIRDYVEKRGHSLLVVGAAPSFVAPFSEVFVNKLWHSGENSTNLAIDSRWVEQDKENRFLAKKLEVKYVSLYKIFCHKTQCKFRLRSGSNSIFTWDYSHLTESGSRFAVSKFRKSLEDSSN
jgi:hypothetical protein